MEFFVYPYRKDLALFCSRKCQRVDNRRCLICKKEFKPINLKKGYGFYCSRECFGKSQKGRIPWNKGMKAKDDIRIARFIEAGHKAKKPPVWNKGLRYGKSNWFRLVDKNGYRNLHKQIQKLYGKPMICDECQTTKKKIYHWANISGKYLKERKDWIRLCPTCHMRMDKPNQQAMEILK